MQVTPRAPHGISLRRLLPEATIVGAADIVVAACSSDSRTCKAGDLFVALLGTECDGHDYAADALGRGATAVLAEQYLPTKGRPVCIVEDSRVAYGKLCQALVGNPSHRLKTIGVTGTHGKTVTTTLIAGILRAAGHRVGLMGTLGNWDGEDYSPTDVTTPKTPVLASWLARMEANGCSHAIVEASSRALAQRQLSGIVLDAACVTNVARDHLDYHTTVQNYRSAKARLLDHLSPEGFAIINADCAVSKDLLKLVSGPALTVGMNSPAEISATIIERNPGEQIFLLSASEDTVAVRSRMIGDHHVANCLMAAATGLAYGIDLPTIARGLESVDQVPGRLERIVCGQSFGVYVDYARTPDALANSLEALRAITAGRILCVFGSPGEADPELRPELAAAAEEYADIPIVTSLNPRSEDPQAIIADIHAGFGAMTHAHSVPDRRSAIAWALSAAREGDCVLIAGKGHEEHELVDGHRIPHDDRHVARQILYKQLQDSTDQPKIRMAA